jgi:putative FmdB family regulatory protein
LITYEYKCDSCSLVEDKRFEFGKAPQKAPCECGSEMRKVFGSTPIVFKGSGWAGKGRIT